MASNVAVKTSIFIRQGEIVGFWGRTAPARRPPRMLTHTGLLKPDRGSAFQINGDIEHNP